MGEHRSGGPRVWLEIALVMAAFVVFARLHTAVAGDPAVALRNAGELIDIERATHVAVEPSVNQWLAEHPGLIAPAVGYYRGYYLAVAAALLLALRAGGAHYLRARRALLWMLALGLVIYWTLPMAPPRFAIPGIVDIVAAHDIFGADLSPSASRGNAYSAMPSMHTALALWCAYAVFSPLRAPHPRVAWLVWLVPAGMVAVVIATGNHYALDVVGSALMLSVAILLAAPLGSRPAGRERSRVR